MYSSGNEFLLQKKKIMASNGINQILTKAKVVLYFMNQD